MPLSTRCVYQQMLPAVEDSLLGSIPTGIDRKGYKVAKQRKKSELPSKVCARCGLPFTWRKKWERDWENVKYCSERCRREAKQARSDG